MNIEGLTLGALILLVLREIISVFLSSRKDHIKDQTKAIQENTLAITKLQVQVESLQAIMQMIPKMKQDIDVAHERIRHLTPRKGN